MIPENFEYLTPASLSEAVGLLEEHGDSAKVLAGGHSLIPMMKLRLAAPTRLIDIGKISELVFINEDDSTLRIGTLTTHHAIANSDVVRNHCQALAEAAGQIGDIQVRNKGTIGGSLAHADPAADYPAAILSSDAAIVAAGPQGDREISATDFFVDMLTTALEPGEIIREIRIPIPHGSNGSAYVKMAQMASGFAICGAAARVAIENGTVSALSVGITGVSGSAYRATGTEDALRGQNATPDAVSAAAAKAADGITALDDIHASADYRLDLARIFAARAIGAAIERAG
jgi:carbon-monoxide dehydrogenase medium subunit